jgi:single-stranded-DNA-specific exonuclease
MMVMTREALNEKREALGIEERAKPITPLITYACMATIADCVSLKSEINRFIIRKGKHDINHGTLPALQVIRENIKTPGALITTMDIAFSLAPRINADSRTGGDGSTSINFLLSKSVAEARKYWEMLTKRNNNRKDEEKVMLNEALRQASEGYYEKGRRGLVIFLPEGNHGIHGIVASRIKERFNCPTIIFSPNNLKDTPSDSRLLSGSGRSVDGIPIDGILSEMQKDIKFKFGGHTMALGAKLNQSDLEPFSLAFDKLVKEYAKNMGFDDNFFYPLVKIDHIFQADDLKWLRGLDVLSELNSLDPFGQRFEQPCFGLNVRVVSFSLIGANKTHVRIKFQDTSGGVHEAMYFNYTTSPVYGTLKVGNSYTLAVDLQYNDFFKRLGMIIQAIEEGYNAVS